MPLTKEERNQLLAKAREKKRQIAEQRRLNEPVKEPVKELMKEEVEEERKSKAKSKPKPKPTKRTLDISSLEDIKKAEEEFEIKNETIRIKAPKKKTIIKRVIEVEEPSSEEEVQEEIVKVPRRSNKSVQLLPEKAHSTVQLPEKASQNKQRDYFNDIFPNN